MKTNMFKKVFACVLALSMMAIPSLSLASNADTTTTLFDIDYSQIESGTYTMEELNAALDAAGMIPGAEVKENSAEDRKWATSHVVDKAAGTAVSSPSDKTSADNANISHVVNLDTPIETGFVSFDYKGSASQGWGTWFNAGHTFAEYRSGYVFSFTPSVASHALSTNFRVNLYRASTSEDWKVYVYDLTSANASLEKLPLVVTGTLAAENLSKFGFGLATTGNGGRSTTTYKMKAVYSPTIPTELYDLDFSNVEDGTYNTAAAIAATGEDNLVSDLISFVVADGIAKTSKTSGTRTTAHLIYDIPVETGAVEYTTQFKLDTIDSYWRGYFAIKSTSNKVATLIQAQNTYAHGWHVSYPAHGTVSVNDSDTITENDYAYNDNSGKVQTIKTVVYRNTTSDSWTVKMYDLTAGQDASKVIATTSLPAGDFPALSATMIDCYGDPQMQLVSHKARTMSIAEATAIKVALPTETQVGVAGASLTVGFSDPVNPDTLSNITFAAADGINKVASVVPASDNKSATITLGTLTDDTTYTLTVPATVTDANGTPVAAASKAITAEADLDKLFAFDFSKMSGEYNASTIQSANGVALSGATLTNNNSSAPMKYTVADGVGTFTTSVSAMPANGNFGHTITFNEAITKGCVQFDISWKEGNNVSFNARNGGILNLVSSKANTSFPAILRASGGTVRVSGDQYTDVTPFIGGKYYLQHYPVADFNLRAVLMRPTEEADWVYRLYDLDISSKTPVLTTTLSKSDYPSITAVTYTSGYTYTTDSLAKTAFTKYSAEFVDASAFDAIEAAWVTNSANAVVTNLANITDGTVNVVADVNAVSGKLYAAIYTDGWKLLDVKSATPAAQGTTVIPFTGIDASAATHVKLFYWDNGFRPLTSFIDPLIKQ